MLENQSTENAASEQSAVTTENKPNDWFSIREAQRAERQKAASPATESEAGSAETPPPAGENPPAAEVSNEVLSKLLTELDGIPLESLSEAQVSALAEKLRSKSLSRFGELTKKAKTLEGQLAELKADREKGFASTPKVENNPYANVETVEALEAEYQKVSGHVEWADALLEDHDSAHPDDVIYTDANGREYTKAAIRQSMRDARKAKDVFINEQYKQIKTKEERKVLKSMAADKAASELPWLKGDDNDTRRQYQSLKESVNFDAIEKADPEFGVHLERILAHAANSMYGKPTSNAAGGQKPPAALNPPSSPSFSGAAPQKANPNADRALQEIEARFAKTQSSDDFLALQKAKRAANAKR